VSPLEQQAYDDHLRVVNRLVAAVERLEVPEPPDYPDWEGSPENAETIETEDPAELRALAVKWQAWASKLDDVLGEIAVDDTGSLQELARQARLSLIALGAYDPPVPGSL
jgi:hypothetical protein